MRRSVVGRINVTMRLYYALAQAVLYIFCFRWRDLVTGAGTDDAGGEDLNVDDALAEDHELVFLPGIKETIHNNIYSRLNPLKVCSPEIVGEFAKNCQPLAVLIRLPSTRNEQADPPRFDFFVLWEWWPCRHWTKRDGLGSEEW